jgi:hypothetical protein
MRSGRLASLACWQSGCGCWSSPDRLAYNGNDALTAETLPGAGTQMWAYPANATTKPVTFHADVHVSGVHERCDAHVASRRALGAGARERRRLAVALRVPHAVGLS